jgi:transposase, IS6 family
MPRRHSRASGLRSSFAGFRFPPEVIVAVRWYLRYAQSYRDVEELLAERGIATIYRSVRRFTPSASVNKVSTSTPPSCHSGFCPRESTG